MRKFIYNYYLMEGFDTDQGHFSDVVPGVTEEEMSANAAVAAVVKDTAKQKIRLQMEHLYPEIFDKAMGVTITELPFTEDGAVPPVEHFQITVTGTDKGGDFEYRFRIQFMWLA